MKLSKYFLIIFLSFWALGGTLSSCDAGSTGNSSSGAAEFQISGDFAGCAIDTIRLYELNGLTTTTIAKAALQTQGNRNVFAMSGPMPPKGLYLIGQAPNNLKPVLLGEPENIQLSGNCNNLRQFGKIEGSPFNLEYEQLNQLFNSFNARRNSLVQQLNNALRANNPGQQQAIGQQLDALLASQQRVIDSLQSANTFFAAAFAPNVVEAFNPLNNPEGYPNSVVHFAEKFLSNIDFSNPVYNHFPIISDNLRVYTQMLFQNLETEVASQYLNAKLEQMEPGSRLHQNSLAAVVQTLDRLENGAFVTYSDRYMSYYSLEAAEQAYLDGRRPQIEAKVQREQALAVGAVPPEIELPNPEGDIVRLSDLKGKVVLLDFWASWCRPCRAENPNVVRVYNQYKDKGFEILGISLDRTKDAWVKAIADDGLAWKHVSDLQFWSSEAAQDYNVGSIPATFLLDRDGKIIAKNLRGPSLEAKLAEVLGS